MFDITLLGSLNGYSKVSIKVENTISKMIKPSKDIEMSKTLFEHFLSNLTILVKNFLIGFVGERIKKAFPSN